MNYKILHFHGLKERGIIENTILSKIRIAFVIVVNAMLSVFIIIRTPFHMKQIQLFVYNGAFDFQGDTWKVSRCT